MERAIEIMLPVQERTWVMVTPDEGGRQAVPPPPKSNFLLDLVLCLCFQLSFIVAVIALFTYLPVSTSIGIFLATMLIILILICYFVPRPEAPTNTKPLRSVRPWRVYSYAELVAATQKFNESNMLASDGHATIFKGVEVAQQGKTGKVPQQGETGNYNIAVKRLFHVSNNAKELKQANMRFKEEVEALSRASHRNVVQFCGYCIQGRERLLVYELLANASLHDWLFSSLQDSHRHTLDWDHRLAIAQGAARGLDYLHSFCNINLVHLDIKPHNILLDDMLNAKIADFGLSHLMSKDGKPVPGSVVSGACGYDAPELNVGGWENNISKKADVYSFGIVLLQLVSGRSLTNPPMLFPLQLPGETFRDAAFQVVNAGKAHMLLDASLADAANNRVGVAMAEVGVQCVEMDPINRPNMHKVSKMLENIV